MYGRPNAYQSNQVSTVSKSKLILLMYDGALRFIAEAKRSIERNDIAGRGLYISKAQKIINELAGSLDRQKGQDVAASLDKVYVEVNRNLTEANIKGDASYLDSCTVMLNTVKGAWEQIISNTASEESPRPVEQKKAGVAISC